MKKILLILCASGLATISNSQIVNGGFEIWNTIAWEDLDTAQTSNSDMIGNALPGNVTKVTPAQNGSYAIKLETSITSTDTNFAYVLFGSFGDNGPEGGFPYTKKPSTLNGYYKSNIINGDSAGIIVAFRKGGVTITMDQFKIGVSNSTYTAFSFPLSISTYSVNPDSVVLVAVSSVPTDIDPTATPKNGTWIIFDNLSFEGPGITQQIPNTNFELWSTISFLDPQGWSTYNAGTYLHLGKKLQVEKTTDKYTGSYALKLTSIYVDSTTAATMITNGENIKGGAGGYKGGIPFNKQIDTLTGYYKYIPSGIDSASVGIQFNKAGIPINYANKWLIPSIAYTYFEIPVNLNQIPDTARIDISSSTWPVAPSNNGSQLIIDDLEWKSSIVTTLIENNKQTFNHTAFPVPTKNHINISLTLEQTTTLELSIYDLSGKLIYRNPANAYQPGKNLIRVNTGSLASGSYYYKIHAGKQQMGSGKFIVE